MFSCSFAEILQFVSNQVDDLPDLIEDQNALSCVQSSRPRAIQQISQTPPTSQTSSAAVFQTSPTVHTPHAVPVTTPQTPAQVFSAQPQTRAPPLLQPKPQPVPQIQLQQAQVKTQALAINSPAQPCQAQHHGLSVQTLAQRVLFTPGLASGSHSHFIQNSLICHQNPMSGFQGESWICYEYIYDR